MRPAARRAAARQPRRRGKTEQMPYRSCEKRSRNFRSRAPCRTKRTLRVQRLTRTSGKNYARIASTCTGADPGADASRVRPAKPPGSLSAVRARFAYPALADPAKFDQLWIHFRQRIVEKPLQKFRAWSGTKVRYYWYSRTQNTLQTTY